MLGFSRGHVKLALPFGGGRGGPCLNQKGVKSACVLLIFACADAQRYVSFASASASSVYPPTSFAAEMATAESSGQVVGVVCV